MKRTKIIEEIAQVSRHLWEKGWAERNAGNISVNITAHLEGIEPAVFGDIPVEPLTVPRPSLKNNIFIITPTGSRMRELTRNTMDQLCYLRINDDGTGIQNLNSTLFESLYPITKTSPEPAAAFLQDSSHPLKPSSELPSHLAIHEMLLMKQPAKTTVIHTHVTELIALTQISEYKSAAKINRLLWGMHPETAMFVPQGAGFVPYTLPGTDAIAQATVKELENHPLVIWEKHGVFATGTTVSETFDTIDIMAKSAKIFFLVRQAGEIPEGLTDEQIREIRS